MTADDPSYLDGYADGFHVAALLAIKAARKWTARLRWRKFNRYDPAMDVLRERLHQRWAYHPQLDEVRDPHWSEHFMRCRWASVPVCGGEAALWRRFSAKYPLAGPKGVLP